VPNLVLPITVVRHFPEVLVGLVDDDLVRLVVTDYLITVVRVGGNVPVGGVACPLETIGDHRFADQRLRLSFDVKPKPFGGRVRLC
jgi:hypothetical protein